MMPQLYKAMLRDERPLRHRVDGRWLYGTKESFLAVCAEGGIAQDFEPVELIECKTIEQQPFYDIYENPFGGYSHYFKADKAKAELAYLVVQGQCVRCVCPRICGLTYQTELLPEQWLSVFVGGEQGTLLYRREQDWIVGQLYYMDICFENRDEMEQDIYEPREVDWRTCWYDLIAE